MPPGQCPNPNPGPERLAPLFPAKWVPPVQCDTAMSYTWSIMCNHERQSIRALRRSREGFDHKVMYIADTLAVTNASLPVDDSYSGTEL
eukprot:438193-Hanusia_phi.AAC.1